MHSCSEPSSIGETFGIQHIYVKINQSTISCMICILFIIHKLTRLTFLSAVFNPIYSYEKSP